MSLSRPVWHLITHLSYALQVLCLGLVGNILRFLYISWLRNPWWVLPFEFMQGELSCLLRVLKGLCDVCHFSF